MNENPFTHLGWQPTTPEPTTPQAAPKATPDAEPTDAEPTDTGGQATSSSTGRNAAASKKRARGVRRTASVTLNLQPATTPPAARSTLRAPGPGPDASGVAAGGGLDAELDAGTGAGSGAAAAGMVDSSGGGLPRLSEVVVPVNWQHLDAGEHPEPVTTTLGPEMDWALVNALKKDSVSLEEEQGRKNLTADQQRAQALNFITQVVNRQVEADLRDGLEWSSDDEARYIKAVFDSRFGLGRIHPLLQIPDAEDVVAVGTHEVLVTHADGHQTRLPPVAEDDADLTEQIAHMAQNATPPRAFDAMHTDVTIMHEGRFRIHAISGEIALHPSIVIRQHLLRRITLADLAARQLMPIEVAHLLDCAIQANMSIAVAGEQGAGKTTLLRALIDAIPARDRFATLETDQELFAHELPGRETSLTLFARDGMGERNADGSFAGAVTVAQMVPPALRQGLTRLILGELRLGYEATAMFEAMQAGAGTLCSVHSPSPQLVASRLADMVSQSGSYSIESAMRQIALSIKLIVYVRRRDTEQGRRRFIEAITLSKLGDDGFSLAPEIIYQADTWTGETLQYTPGDLAQELAGFQRPLRRYEQDPQ